MLRPEPRLLGFLFEEVKTVLRIMSLAVMALLISSAGCISSRGVIPFSNGSNTELNNADFKIVRANLRGEANCGYLLGIIPMGDPSIATRAMDQLVNAAGATGKSVGLINFAGDEVVANYLNIFVIRTVIMRADAVEFSK